MERVYESSREGSRIFLESIGIKQVMGEYKRIAVPPIKNLKMTLDDVIAISGSGSPVSVWYSQLVGS